MQGFGAPPLLGTLGKRFAMAAAGVESVSFFTVAPLEGWTMELLRLSIGVVGLSLLFFLVSCGGDSTEKTGAEDVKKETKEAVEAVQDYASEKKADFEEQIRQQLDALKQDIAQLESKVEAMGQDAQEGMEEQLAALKEQRQNLQAKLEQLQDAGNDTWQELKKESSQAMEDLKQSYEDLQPSTSQN